MRSYFDLQFVERRRLDCSVLSVHVLTCVTTLLLKLDPTSCLGGNTILVVEYWGCCCCCWWWWSDAASRTSAWFWQSDESNFSTYPSPLGCSDGGLKCQSEVLINIWLRCCIGRNRIMIVSGPIFRCVSSIVWRYSQHDTASRRTWILSSMPCHRTMPILLGCQYRMLLARFILYFMTPVAEWRPIDSFRSELDDLRWQILAWPQP